jgi:hypothetical protein
MGPSILVVLVGLATCSLVDVADPDTFHVEATVPHPSGVRAAVVVRHRHTDSSTTVKCVWLLTGSAPRLGRSVRLADRCVLVATDPDLPIRLTWQRSGRLAAEVSGVPTSPMSDHRSMECYFEAERLGRHICYAPRDIDIVSKP